MAGQESPDTSTASPRTPEVERRRRQQVTRTISAVTVVAGVVLGVVALERVTRPPEVPGPGAASQSSSGAPAPGATRRSPEPTSRSSRDASDYPRFGAGNLLRVEVTEKPVAPRSSQMVARLLDQINNPRYGNVVGINTWSYAGSLARADQRTPRRDVRFVNCQKKKRTPAGLYNGPKYFARVPIPDDAVPSPGIDGHLAVWDPHTDQLWEFWKARRATDGTWEACWGGRIDQVSESIGRFPAPYGVSASGLVTTAFMITLDEARRGQIDHAMGLVIPHPKVGWVPPANRSDGHSTNPDDLPEGTRLRLPADVDVESLGLPPLGKAVARAAQRYGFVVVDRGGHVVVVAETGAAEAARTGKNPWEEILKGRKGYEQLMSFPWDRLQVVD